MSAINHIDILDGKYSERVQLPANAIWGRYNSPSPLLPHPSTDRNETRTWSSLAPRNFFIKFGTNPSTIFLVIVVTDSQTHRQTDTQTNASKNILPRFAGRISL